MIYALVVYQRRAHAIRNRSGAPYDDRLGPVSTITLYYYLANNPDNSLCLPPWWVSWHSTRAVLPEIAANVLAAITTNFILKAVYESEP